MLLTTTGDALDAGDVPDGLGGEISGGGTGLNRLAPEVATVSGFGNSWLSPVPSIVTGSSLSLGNDGV